MLIVESTIAKAANGKALRIGVIGSCRVMDPIHQLAAAGEVVISLYQPPVTHTTGEALQALRLATGEFQVPPGFEQYVLENEPLPPNAYPPELVGSVDVWIVEISSREQISCGGIMMNANFFARNFVQRFAKQLLTWYRNLLLGKAMTADLIASVAHALERDGAGEAERRLVTHTERAFTDAGRMLDDVRDLLRHFPDRHWVLVGVATDPDDPGTVTAERLVLNRELAQIAHDTGCSFLEPTDFVRTFGRGTVFASDGADIYHYAPDFLPEVGRTLILAASGLDIARQQAVMTARRAYFDLVEQANAELVKLHTVRVAELGVDGSGLYAHYEHYRGQGSVIPQANAALASALADGQRFGEHLVLRAGLGEIAIALGLAGLKATAFDPDVNRRKAIAAGIAHLEQQGLLERNLVRVSGEGLPPVGAPGRDTKTLAICTHVIVGDMERDGRAVLESLGGADTILVNPRTFLQSAAGVPPWSETLERLRRMGFTHNECWGDLLFLSRT